MSPSSPTQAPITIAVGAYGRPEFLPAALASISHQSLQPCEVRVHINPHSAERDAAIIAILKQFEGRLPGFIWRVNERNLGMAGNWNSLADEAQGRLIMFLGDDDLLEPNCLEGLLAVAPCADDIGVSFGLWRAIDTEGRDLPPPIGLVHPATTATDLAEGRVHAALAAAWRHVIQIQAAIYRTDRVRSERFYLGHNMPEPDLHIRLFSQHDDRLYFTRRVLAQYRIHPRSSTSFEGYDADLLAHRLLGFPARPEAEPYRTKSIEAQLVMGVYRAIRRGDTKSAVEFLGHPNLPRERLSLANRFLLGLVARSPRFCKDLYSSMRIRRSKATLERALEGALAQRAAGRDERGTAAGKT